ncbi:tetratricopeptide repeat protein [Dyella sp. 2HG41-7]|uniref:O-linked N-acetylglucosamine transferase, SPINDLY family protein n=1 Tax=Dyella sp. 2HG41-7 TaxID=2883239 RepID=UPI001F24D659|nr:tetratricopeptide repeat protein [Dyella sp. 2HG41-7]
MTDAPSTDIASTLQKLNELLQRNNNEEAVRFASTARRQFPVSAELIRLHGLALLRLGHRREAQVAMNRAAELAPDNIELQCNLANLAMSEGRAGAAIERMQRALMKTPGHPALLQTLGGAYMSAGQRIQARDAFASALQRVPQHPAIRLNLAAVEIELGHFTEAEALLRQVLQQTPNSDLAHAMLGHLLYMQRRPKEAAASLLQAGQLAPNNVQHVFQAALMMAEMNDLSAAQEGFTEALRRAPDSAPIMSQLLLTRRRLCRWQDIDALSKRVVDAASRGDQGVHPFAFLSEGADAALQLRCAKNYASAIEEQAAPLRKQLNLRHALPLPDAPIRVGMLAEGFNDTAAGQHIVGFVEALAESDLDIHLFAITPDDGSPVRRRLSAAATLHDISALDRAQAASLIHGTAIEILFDLNGYRGRANTELMALRAAPIQVGWLGYPGSSGAPWMDYLVTDAITLPSELRAHVSEKVIRLPRCHQPSDPNRFHSEPPPRSACGLPEKGVVFACFSDTHTITPEVFVRYMLILEQVPDSVLWLLSEPSDTNERLRQAAQAVDIDPERLIFMPRVQYSDYLGLYAHVDLYLDTVPINSRAAASDALWANRPVLTRTGNTIASRTVASLLHHFGLPELITADNASFVDMAVTLGNDTEALATLRRHLMLERSLNPLFDLKGLASDFRRAVRAISARYRIGRPPTDVDL